MAHDRTNKSLTHSSIGMVHELLRIWDAIGLPFDTFTRSDRWGYSPSAFPDSAAERSHQLVCSAP